MIKTGGESFFHFSLGKGKGGVARGDILRWMASFDCALELVDVVPVIIHFCLLNKCKFGHTESRLDFGLPSVLCF